VVLARFGLHFEVLWEVFLVTFSRFGPFAGLHSLSSQNLTLPGLGGLLSTSLSTFPGAASRACFSVTLYDSL
jgi:hypothetical protein